MRMVIYRYELPDGGGPFFTKDGHNRIYPSIIFNDNTISGCGNITLLDDWFRNENIPTNDFKLQKYIGEVVYIGKKSGEIRLKQNTAIKLKIKEIL